MTAIELRKGLKNRVEEALVGLKLNSQEQQVKSIQVFEQSLPRKSKSTSRNPTETDHPYVIVYIDEGNNESVKILLIASIYDESTENDGSDDIFTILEKISQDLNRTPIVNGKFEMTSLQWFFNDQDTYPYYFGWVETVFTKPLMTSDIGEEYT